MCNDIIFIINMKLYFLSNWISLFVFIHDALLINFMFSWKNVNVMLLLIILLVYYNVVNYIISSYTEFSVYAIDIS